MADSQGPDDGYGDHFSDIELHMRVAAQGAAVDAVEVGVRGGAVTFLIFQLMGMNVPFLQPAPDKGIPVHLIGEMPVEEINLFRYQTMDFSDSSGQIGI